MSDTDQQIALVIKRINQIPRVNGVIGVTYASKILGCSPNTVKNYAKRDRLLRYFYINYKKPGHAMLLYRIDVAELKKVLIKKAEDELKQMKGSKK